MKKFVELDEAIELMKNYSCSIEETELIPLKEANGRILAENIYALLPQPIFSKSAVDGYALNYKDTISASQSAPIKMSVKENIYAGDYSDYEIKHNEAVRIMTGARVPKSCNCVIRLEDTNDSDDLAIYVEAKENQNICIQGEDFEKGEELLSKDIKLDYITLAIISSIGKNEVLVYKKLKIALCVTGDEVVFPGRELKPGKIYDSNTMLISQRLKVLGYDCDTYHIHDDIEECRNTLSDLSKKYDLIITTGGVSVGRKDILHDALKEEEKKFWKVRLKPGTPALFSVMNETPILSLSGNPFACLTTFELLGRNLISYMQKDELLKPVSTKAVMENCFNKKSSRRRFVRAIYHQGKVLILSGMHSSNELKSLIGCNALIDIPNKSDVLKENDEVTVWLL